MPSRPQSGTKKLRALSRQAKALSLRRAALCLTQDQAAAQLGVKKQTYLTYEHGRRAPRPADRLRIVEAWDLDPKDMSLGMDQKCPSCGRAY